MLLILSLFTRRNLVMLRVLNVAWIDHLADCLSLPVGRIGADNHRRHVQGELQRSDESDALRFQHSSDPFDHRRRHSVHHGLLGLLRSRQGEHMHVDHGKQKHPSSPTTSHYRKTSSMPSYCWPYSSCKSPSECTPSCKWRTRISSRTGWRRRCKWSLMTTSRTKSRPRPLTPPSDG